MPLLSQTHSTALPSLKCYEQRYEECFLGKALKDAVADGLIPRNVSEGIKAPRPKKKEINPLSPDQTRAFLRAVSSDLFEALYVLAVHTGLRAGELLGLKWEDVDLEGGTLQVRRTLSETRTGHIFEAPKNGKGRNIRLTAGAVDALKQHKATQNAERLKAGPTWEDNGLIFPSQRGTTMNAKNLTARSFKPILKRTGLPDIRASRSAPHVRYPATKPRRSSEVRPRIARTRNDRHNARHLQPCPARHGRSDCRRYGSRAYMLPVVVKLSSSRPG